MNPRPFIWFAGTSLLLLGVGGFVPPITPVEADPLRVAAGVGGPQLFGLFPISPALNVVHVLLGAWGIWSGPRLGRSVRYARRVAIVLLVLALMGTMPGADTMFGAAPLYGNNILLHGLLALLSFLFGWLYRKPTTVMVSEAEPVA